jgi:hypothetical protein
MFQSRQYEEIQPLMEVSRCVATPGAVGNGTTVAAIGTNCFIGTQTGTSGSPATFALGDQLEVFPSAAAAVGNLIVTAAPGNTPGVCALYFQNQTGGSVTPVAGALYTIVATRISQTVM